MLRSLRSRLLSSVVYAPETGGGAGGETPDDERIEIDETDDELTTDPAGEPEAEAAGDTDAEPEDDAEDAADDDDEPAGGAERQPSRSERRIVALRERERTVSEENARLTRQLDELRRAPPAAVQPAETPSQRADRLALMSPEERIREEVRESLDRSERNHQALASQLMDQSDRAAFEASVVGNPLARKFAPEVERRLADVRSRGQNLPRHAILTYLVGEKVLAQRAAGKPKAQQERVRRETARPANGRGDAPSDRRGRRDGGDTAALERRLENVQI